MELHLPPGSNLIGCSAKELGEIREYVRKLEVDRHTLQMQVVVLENARSLQFARALGQLWSRPRSALRQIWQLLVAGSARAPDPAAIQHRGFAALQRRALPPVSAAANALHRTVLMEVAARLDPVHIVIPSGCGGRTGEGDSSIDRITVGPHDYELLLRNVDRPILYIETRCISSSSPWFGVFGPDDMRLNLCMAGLIETVKLKGGRVAFSRQCDGMEAPLVADFAAGAESVADFAALLRMFSHT
jgi:hypothetical protein